MKLKGLNAIVTGGGSGIGEAICHAYAEEGATVLIIDIDLKGAKRVASNINSSAGQAFSYQLDISKVTQIRAVFEEILAKHKKVDVLVNNAGARIIKGFMQHTIKDWESMLSINLTGPFLCAQAVIPSMVKIGGGKIINLCSIASYIGRPNRCAYVAAKTGLLGLTRALSIDMAGKNIRVNSIAPGMIASPFNQKFSESEETGESWAGENSLGRWGQPSDISGAAVFLASEDSQFVNGSTICIEGGWLGGRARQGEVPI